MDFVIIFVRNFRVAVNITEIQSPRKNKHIGNNFPLSILSVVVQ